MGTNTTINDLSAYIGDDSKIAKNLVQKDIIGVKS